MSLKDDVVWPTDFTVTCDFASDIAWSELHSAFELGKTRAELTTEQLHKLIEKMRNQLEIDIFQELKKPVKQTEAPLADVVRAMDLS